MNLFFHLLVKTYKPSILFSILYVVSMYSPVYGQGCSCSGRMTSVTFKYDENASTDVDLFVYNDHQGTDLIQAFYDVQPGDFLTVDASMVGLPRFNNKIYLGTTVGNCLTYVQTSCYVDIIGDIFIGFEAVAYEDYAGNSCFQPSALGNRVFEDVNANGIQDAGEIGMDGITVILYDENGVPEDTDITTNGGEYEFTNLEPGDYTVGFPSLPFGYSNTIANAGLNDQIDSDVEENTHQTAMIHLEPSQVDDSWDLGIVQGESFPVELIQFDVELWRNTAVLKWSTATELNNDRFEIERSLDQESFEWIGSIDGAGTSQTVQEYGFEDTEAAFLNAPRVFYRMKQIDFDGQYEYSPVLELQLPEKGDLTFDVFPNPVSDVLQVEVFAESGRLQLMDMNGRIVYEQTFSPDPALVRTQIDVSTLAKGTYLLQLKDRYGIQTKQIICR